MSTDLEALDRRHLWHPFTQADEWERSSPVVVDRAEGAWLIDTQGHRYLDGVASLWVGVHGHRHPHVDAAVRAQLDKVAHSTLLGLANTPSAKLAGMLCQRTGFDRVFYSDSGSAAVEIALKMAFQWQQQQGHSQRTRFARLEHAYHGDTLGAVSVGGIELFHQVYGPLLFDSVALPSPADHEDQQALAAEAIRRLEAHGPQLAGLIVEPFVQGAAGMRMHGKAFLDPVLKRARELGALILVDEVATGLGRTGSFLASERLDLRPDFVCLGKGLSNGYLPLAATLSTERIFDGFRGDHGRTFFHGHTFTGNPLACAAAIACLELFETQHTLAHVEKLAAHLEGLLEELAQHPRVRSVRQTGLMAGVDLQRPDGSDLDPIARTGHQVCMSARAHGVLLRPLGDTVVLMPPLCMSIDELTGTLEGLRRALEDH